MGTVLAVGIAFLYSLHIVSRRGVPAPGPRPDPDFGFVVLDSVVIGACVGLSLLAAYALQLDRPYWVPVSCLAVIRAHRCGQPGRGSFPASPARHWGCSCSWRSCSCRSVRGAWPLC